MVDIDVNSLINQHRREVELGEAMTQLSLNPAFKLVIENHLFKETVQGLVLQLASISKSTSQYEEVLRELDAISYLQNYLQNTITKGVDASLSIREAQYLLNHDED